MAKLNYALNNFIIFEELKYLNKQKYIFIMKHKPTNDLQFHSVGLQAKISNAKSSTK